MNKYKIAITTGDKLGIGAEITKKALDVLKPDIKDVLIVGENEVNTGLYALKNMTSGEQFNLSKEDCLKKILN